MKKFLEKYPKLLHLLRVLKHVHLNPMEKEIKIVKQFLNVNEVSIDVGANIGIYSEVLSQNSKMVISFEPNPYLAVYLNQIKKSTWIVENISLSSVEGISTLKIPIIRDIEKHGKATISKNNIFQSEIIDKINKHEVEMISLDEYLIKKRSMLQIQAISFIKIDVEGHELEVLKGALKTIKKFRPILMVECECRHGVNVDEIFDYFNTLHYSPHYYNSEMQTLELINNSQLQLLQTENLIMNNKSNSYINNFIFIPNKKIT